MSEETVSHISPEEFLKLDYSDRQLITVTSDTAAKEARAAEEQIKPGDLFGDSAFSRGLSSDHVLSVPSHQKKEKSKLSKPPRKTMQISTFFLDD